MRRTSMSATRAKQVDGWVITHDGRTAWKWLNPKVRVNLLDPNAFARNHTILSDDRGKGFANVWD